MKALFVRGASPPGTPLHTRSRGPHDPCSARVAHSLALVRAKYPGMARASLVALVVLSWERATLLACPVCFGAAETPMIDGAKLGALALLVITLVVQAGFVGFFLYLRKHAKRIADVELDTEWSELQRGPRTS